MAYRVFLYIFLFCLHLYTIHAHFFESSDNISTPLDFLTQLSEVKKGQHRNGVDELKKHLAYLGYMNQYSIYSSDYHHKNENIFDDSLELALKRYQKFYYLNITGVLDADTISHMRLPRCGMPDFYNSNESVIPFHMTSHYTFLPGQPKWSKRTLKYAFDTNVKEEQKPPLERAFREWTSVKRFKFIRVSNLREADFSISFMPKEHGDGRTFVEDSLAHAFPPPDGRIHFDASKKWSVNAKFDKKAFDIQTVGMHELGHALGLGHSRIKKALMYPSLGPGERKGLHIDDYNGIRALYKL